MNKLDAAAWKEVQDRAALLGIPPNDPLLLVMMEYVSLRNEISISLSIRDLEELHRIEASSKKIEDNTTEIVEALLVAAGMNEDKLERLNEISRSSTFTNDFLSKLNNSLSQLHSENSILKEAIAKLSKPKKPQASLADTVLLWAIPLLISAVIPLQLFSIYQSSQNSPAHIQHSN